MLDLIYVFLFAVLLYWVGGIYFALRNAANEIIKGLNSIDQRLAKPPE